MTRRSIQRKIWRSIKFDHPGFEFGWLDGLLWLGVVVFVVYMLVEK